MFNGDLSKLHFPRKQAKITRAVYGNTVREILAKPGTPKLV